MSDIIREYENAVEIVQGRITEREKRLEVLQRQGKILFDEAYQIKNELVILRDEYADAVRALSEIRSYYL